MGVLVDMTSGSSSTGSRNWYVGTDGVKRWLSNDQPCDTSNEHDLWKCTRCGRVGSVGRCCGLETREPIEPPNA
jgi:hypothetical protein